MTSALAQPRSPITYPLTNVALPIVAGAPKVWSGARVYLDVAAGGIRPGIAGNPNLFFAGDAQETVDNSGGSTTAPVLVRIPDELNCEWCDNSTASPVTTLFGLCYVDSDHSVSSSPVGNSVAGRVWALDTIKGVLVQPLLSLLESYLGEEASIGGNPALKARAVITSIQAYGGSGTGTLTETSNGAFATQDGVSTLAVGDIVLLPAGTTNITAAKDAGPYQIVSLGGASSTWKLTRPSWWLSGSAIVPGTPIEIGGEGTLFQGTTWKSCTAKGQIVDTNDPVLYPGRVSQQVTLAASTVTISNVPILSAKSAVLAELALVGGTTTSTVGYGTLVAPTPGPIGTASTVVDALASGMTKNGSADTSTLNVVITNF